MPQELKIAMLGARGVGKTSLLTAMYQQFDSTIGKTGLQLIPDEESSAILQERLGELTAQVDDFEATPEIEGTDKPQSFIFDIGQKGKKPSLRLHFQDFPGGYLSSQATPDQKKSIETAIQESVAILIPIDAPALMQQVQQKTKVGKWHEYVNKPSRIKDLLAKAYTDINSPRLVIFAPVKCETYVRDQSGANLLKQVRNGYANLLELFKAETLNPWIVSVVTPVQTVGNAVFSRTEVEDKVPHFRFRKIYPGAEYDPKNSDQPLRYLLRFLLRLELEGKKRGLRGWWRERFKMNEYLKSAIDESGKGCKSGDGFAVLQGQNWLNK